MDIIKYGNHGAIGTKLGTFIINDNLVIVNKHVPIPVYSKYLSESINIGIKWLHKQIEDSTVESKYSLLLDKFISLIDQGNYTDDLNQNIIEVVCNLLNKLNKLKLPDSIRSSQEIKRSPEVKRERRVGHLGPQELSQINEKDVDFSRALMVQTSTGKYELFFYVRHNDHNDILPYEYIADKVKNIPQLMFNGYKIIN